MCVQAACPQTAGGGQGRESCPAALAPLAGQGAKCVFGETLPCSPRGRHPANGPPAAASPTQPLPLSSSCRERVRTEGFPFAQGIPIPSNSISLPAASTFCCPLPEEAASPPGSQGCFPLLPCAPPSSLVHPSVPTAQRLLFLPCQPKACFPLSHAWHLSPPIRSRARSRCAQLGLCKHLPFPTRLLIFPRQRCWRRLEEGRRLCSPCSQGLLSICLLLPSLQLGTQHSEPQLFPLENCSLAPEPSLSCERGTREAQGSRG